MGIRRRRSIRLTAMLTQARPAAKAMAVIVDPGMRQSARAAVAILRRRPIRRGIAASR